MHTSQLPHWTGQARPPRSPCTTMRRLKPISSATLEGISLPSLCWRHGGNHAQKLLQGVLGIFGLETLPYASAPHGVTDGAKVICWSASSSHKLCLSLPVVPRASFVGIKVLPALTPLILLLGLRRCLDTRAFAINNSSPSLSATWSVWIAYISHFKHLLLFFC